MARMKHKPKLRHLLKRVQSLLRNHTYTEMEMGCLFYVQYVGKKGNIWCADEKLDKMLRSHKYRLVQENAYEFYEIKKCVDNL